MILAGGHRLNLCDMELTRAAPLFTGSLTCFPDIVLIHNSSISQSADWSALSGWPRLTSFLMFHLSSISHQEVLSGVYPIDSFSVVICRIANDWFCWGVGHSFLVGFPMCHVDDLCWAVLLLSAVSTCTGVLIACSASLLFATVFLVVCKVPTAVPGTQWMFIPCWFSYCHLLASGESHQGRCFAHVVRSCPFSNVLSAEHAVDSYNSVYSFMLWQKNC